jgi:RNA polymerase sigma factor (TIGR02999 family)
MSDASPEGNVTQLLEAIQKGDEQAHEQLWLVIYDELRGVAERLMKAERPGHTLQATALLHEAFPRLFDAALLSKAGNRSYFFGAAARAMRHILVDHARKRQANRHGGGLKRTPLDDVLDGYEDKQIDLLALHDALERLRALHPRQYQIVDEYHFGGFTLLEIAEHLGVSEATVSTDFKRARLWLASQMSAE